MRWRITFASVGVINQSQYRNKSLKINQDLRIRLSTPNCKAFHWDNNSSLIQPPQISSWALGQRHNPKLSYKNLPYIVMQNSVVNALMQWKLQFTTVYNLSYLTYPKSEQNNQLSTTTKNLKSVTAIMKNHKKSRMITSCITML